MGERVEGGGQTRCAKERGTVNPCIPFLHSQPALVSCASRSSDPQRLYHMKSNSSSSRAQLSSLECPWPTLLTQPFPPSSPLFPCPDAMATLSESLTSQQSDAVLYVIISLNKNVFITLAAGNQLTIGSLPGRTRERTLIVERIIYFSTYCHNDVLRTVRPWLFVCSNSAITSTT